MKVEAVRIERRGATLEIVLDRPPANAISAATSRTLTETWGRRHNARSVLGIGATLIFLWASRG